MVCNIKPYDYIYVGLVPMIGSSWLSRMEILETMNTCIDQFKWLNDSNAETLCDATSVSIHHVSL